MHVEIAEPFGDLDVLQHRTTEHADLAVELLRHVEDDLQAVNRRSESGDDDAPFGLVKSPRRPG
jgi:hypothetical protein